MEIHLVLLQKVNLYVTSSKSDTQVHSLKDIDDE